MRKSSLQWSFANNSAAAYSQFLSFKSSQEQGGSHKQYPPGFSQRSLSLEKQGGSQHLISGHPWKTNDQANQIVPSAITTCVVSSHLTSNPPNVVSSTVSPTPAPPSNGPVVGSTDLKSSPGISIGPCQLTLFYNGAVCVYDNVSPEKAQAIMLLAGNGDSKNSIASPAATLPSLPKVQPPVLRPLPVKDTVIPNLSVGLSNSISSPTPVSSFSAVATSVANQSVGFSSSVSLPTPLSSLPAVASSVPNKSLGFSSSVSVPKPLSSLPAVASSSAVDISPIKPLVTQTRVKCPESPKSDAPVGGLGASGVKSTSSAVPQARKASLARFLEKRKERVTGASPYVISKDSTDCSPIAAGKSKFLSNSASSSPLPASN